MSSTITEATLFKSKPSKAESKADATSSAARAILDDETARREAKTARLRAARMKQEEKQAAEPAPAAKPRKRKAAARS